MLKTETRAIMEGAILFLGTAALASYFIENPDVLWKSALYGSAGIAVFFAITALWLFVILPRIKK
jgi:hypothetical protein